MKETAHIPVGLRVMAFFCHFCPCCLIARRFPNSAFARNFRKIQHRCPFCRSYEKVQILVKGQGEPEEPVEVNERKNSGGWGAAPSKSHSSHRAKRTGGP